MRAAGLLAAAALLRPCAVDGRVSLCPEGPLLAAFPSCSVASAEGDPVIARPALCVDSCAEVDAFAHWLGIPGALVCTAVDRTAACAHCTRNHSAFAMAATEGAGCTAAAAALGRRIDDLPPEFADARLLGCSGGCPAVAVYSQAQVPDLTRAAQLADALTAALNPSQAQFLAKRARQASFPCTVAQLSTESTVCGHSALTSHEAGAGMAFWSFVDPNEVTPLGYTYAEDGSVLRLGWQNTYRGALRLADLHAQSVGPSQLIHPTPGRSPFLPQGSVELLGSIPIGRSKLLLQLTSACMWVRPPSALEVQQAAVDGVGISILSAVREDAEPGGLDISYDPRTDGLAATVTLSAMPDCVAAGGNMAHANASTEFQCMLPVEYQDSVQWGCSVLGSPGAPWCFVNHSAYPELDGWGPNDAWGYCRCKSVPVQHHLAARNVWSTCALQGGVCIDDGHEAGCPESNLKPGVGLCPEPTVLHPKKHCCLGTRRNPGWRYVCLEQKLDDAGRISMRLSADNTAVASGEVAGESTWRVTACRPSRPALMATATGTHSTYLSATVQSSRQAVELPAWPSASSHCCMSLPFKTRSPATLVNVPTRSNILLCAAPLQTRALGDCSEQSSCHVVTRLTILV